VTLFAALSFLRQHSSTNGPHSFPRVAYSMPAYVFITLFLRIMSFVPWGQVPPGSSLTTPHHTHITMDALAVQHGIRTYSLENEERSGKGNFYWQRDALSQASFSPKTWFRFTATPFGGLPACVHLSGCLTARLPCCLEGRARMHTHCIFTWFFQKSERRARAVL